MRYYIADSHFFHGNLNTKMDFRGFENVEEMNGYMLQKWNAKVRKNDDVVIWGEWRRDTMNTYRTAEVAAIIGIHPNTVRLYEKLKLIPKPERLPNGYRVFTEFHIKQCRLIRLAFQVEVMQNGLRKKIAQMIMVSAAGDFDTAIALTEDYLKQIRQKHLNAEEAIEIVKQILSGGIGESSQHLKRKDVSELLDISMDMLRNWEMNGLLTVKRKDNGYRVYTDKDIQRLKIIRSLRCANYSLEAILRLLQQLSQNPDTDTAACRIRIPGTKNLETFSSYPGQSGKITNGKAVFFGTIDMNNIDKNS